MTAPDRSTSHSRLLSHNKFRLTILLSLVAICATVLASTNSSARSLGQRFFARAAAIVSGSGEVNVAPANHSLTSAEAVPQSPSSTMATARRGHTTTRLSDGRVLIAGGDNASGGYLSEAEIFDPVNSTFTVVGSMTVGRADHAAVKLSDGRVLIAGGRTAIGTTDATEVFDPNTGTFTPGPTMSMARADHSATLLADGRVVVAGGDASGSAEIFNSGSFTAVSGNLTTARAKHSAALLLDGRVLIVGGRDTNGTDLSSMEIFNPADESFSNAGDITMARVLPHLRVLFDGKVQIIGGNNDESMEIYDSVSRELGAYAHVLPATDTCTGLRPGIMASQTRAALFHNGQSDVLLDRSGHTISELAGTNQALVVGGANSSGVVLDSTSVLASSPTSITTDKLDYAPGETVNISGRGWQPGETVRLRIHEDPHTPQERGLDVVAAADGSFVGTYLVQDYDLDMKFIVTARGLTSGWNAQTTFTDANNDAHIAPGWAATNTTVTFNTLYRKTTGGTVQHVRITLPVGYTNISVPTTAFSSGTWSTPTINQVTRTIDVQLTAGTGLTTNNVDWARIDVIATTPAANQSGNAAEWLMETFTDTAGTAGKQDDNPPVLVGATTDPSATITFVDAGGNPIVSPVLQNGIASTLRVRVTSQQISGTTIKYTDVAVPTCFSSPTSVTATVSTGGNAYDTPVLVTDGFIRLSGGSIATNGTLTVTFNTTPNCTSGIYLVSSTPSTNASNPPSSTNQSVSTTGGSLTIAAGLADLSITKTDSPDPVATGETLTYTIAVNNAGPNDASAVKVVDTLPSGVTFVSATGTNWNCNHSSGTVTCNRTGGNLAPGAAPDITIVVTAPSTAGSITNSATVSSPNDNTPGNNTATATTTVAANNNAPAGTDNTVTTNEDVAHTFTAAQFGFSDPNDTPADNFQAVKITTVATDGKLKLSGVDVTAGQFISVTDINAGNLKFFPDANENGTPYASFTFQVQDDGGTAGGGIDLDPTANTMTINVTSVNDEPAGTNNTVATNEDTAYTFTAGDFGFSDPNDTPANTLAAVQITTVATDGKLKLNGVDVTAGQSIPVADINAGNLKFFPDANENGSPYATFTFQVQDNGGTANGGVDLDQSANTMTVNVNAVNDEPAGANNTVSTNEDTAYTFAAAEFGFTDPNDTPANTLAAVKITTVATDGKLKLNGVDVTAGQVILLADINAGNLKFFPDANEHGSPYATFTFQVQDDGGTANGGVDLDQSPNTMTINVTPVNDAPAGADNSVTTDEDMAYTFAAAEFGFTDPNDTPANTLAAVKITTVATDGKLKLSGVDVIAGQFISVADIGAGNLKFFPDANENGTPYATFTFQVQDNGGTANGGVDLDQSPNTMTINVNAVNDTPDAVDDSATVDEDTTNNAINVLANDTDADNLTPPFNAGLTVIAVTQGTHGSVNFTASGVTYTPNANYFGTDSFTYTISDNGTNDAGHTDTATVNVTINNVNDTPDAFDDSATVDEDTTNNAIDVLANDTDADNLTPPFNAGLTVIAVTQGAHGSVTFTPTGVSYTPAPNYFGSDSFTYTISDNGTSDAGHTDTATVNVTINNVNDAPDAVDDSATVDEDTTNNAINVLANDTDADNLTPPFNAGLTVIAVTQGAHGTVTFTAGGVSYTPAPNYFGSDSFTYTISDNGTNDAGHTDTATVNVTINNINDTPDAVDDSATVDEDTTNNAINVLANDTDADNLTPPFNAGLTVIAVTQGAHGTVTFTAGGVSYTPAPNYFGSDSFTYTISDNGTSDAGHTDTATVNVTINNVNDTPDAVDDSATVDEDTTNNAINVLANDTDADNLTPPFNAGLTVIAVTQGAHGSVTFTPTGVSYTPAPNYFGSDSFTYTISDNGTSDAGHTDTATVNVTINNVNDPPDAVDDSATVDEDTTNNAINVLANDTDADNLTPPFNAGLTVIAVTQGAHGTVTFTAGGVSYTPAPNYFGSDSFTYTISDNGTSDAGHTDTATVNVTINNVNDTPDAVDDSATVDEDSTNNAIDVLANDTDADNLTPPANAGLTVIAVTQGTHGSVNFTASGVTYTPNANYFGTDSFTYTISDNGTNDAGHTDTATVNVTVNNINDTPDAVDDSATVAEDSSNNAINVLANDTDADNLTPPFNAGLTVIAVTPAAHGTVNFTASGVTYTPAADYFGPDSFTYTISDNGTNTAGHTDTATVHITVTNVNDAPVMNTLTIAPGVINENASAVLNGSFSDADPTDAHTVVISWGDGSPNTTLTLAAGVLTFTANHQYKDDNPTNTAFDVNTVTATVCDGGADGNISTDGDDACASQNTTITVNNLAPIISSANGPTTPQPSGSSVTVTANFTDVGTQDTHLCSVNWDDGSTTNGTVTEVNGSGMCTASHTYTAPGVYSVVVTITDDDTGSASRPIDLQFIVIFDPNAGFVTGGGWIMSPVGACQLTPGCAALSGKANFGFVSKYKKGSNTPDGQTEFQFHAGDLNFHSSAYDYGSLVVSGFKAQYRGTGVINGVPGYKFVLTAYDGGGGGIDKFRIKITKDGIVVYDNRLGASDDIDLADPLAISGGSIVIHK